jgi:hypothetical protein
VLDGLILGDPNTSWLSSIVPGLEINFEEEFEFSLIYSSKKINKYFMVIWIYSQSMEADFFGSVGEEVTEFAFAINFLFNKME